MKELMNENQYTVKTEHAKKVPDVEVRHDTSLQELWARYGDNSYTIDDLAWILDLAKDDENLQEFYEAWNSAWNNAPPESKEQQEMLRREVAQLIAKYGRKRKIQPTGLSSLQTIGRFLRTWYGSAAAVLLLGMLIPVTYLYVKPKTEQISVHYVEEITQRGEIKTVVLPDQTEVTLNVGSRIKYPVNFTGAERSVELYGEALFDVTSDPARPFIVQTENLNIKVVGTVFDVKEYADDLTASVSVASGKVEVGLADEKVMLEQNQQVKMNKATGTTEATNIDADSYLSWTNGTLYFNGMPIREVVNMLNRHYPQVVIELAEGEYSYLIMGEHQNVYPVEDILSSIMVITGLKCRKTGVNKYTLYKN